jgi:hypothetical protein
MRVLQLLKIPCATLPDLLLHLKILHKLPLLLKIHHLHNLLSIILYCITLLLTLLLDVKIDDLFLLYACRAKAIDGGATHRHNTYKAGKNS